MEQDVYDSEGIDYGDMDDMEDMNLVGGFGQGRPSEGISDAFE